MNFQSDYGYQTGGVEVRDVARCLSAACACRRYSRDPAHLRIHPREVYRDWARRWIAEGKQYRRHLAA